jgi:hypothetical protein
MTGAPHLNFVMLLSKLFILQEGFNCENEELTLFNTYGELGETLVESKSGTGSLWVVK